MVATESTFLSFFSVYNLQWVILNFLSVEWYSRCVVGGCTYRQKLVYLNNSYIYICKAPAKPLELVAVYLSKLRYEIFWPMMFSCYCGIINMSNLGNHDLRNLTLFFVFLQIHIIYFFITKYKPHCNLYYSNNCYITQTFIIHQLAVLWWRTGQNKLHGYFSVIVYVDISPSYHHTHFYITFLIWYLVTVTYKMQHIFNSFYLAI